MESFVVSSNATAVEGLFFFSSETWTLASHPAFSCRDFSFAGTGVCVFSGKATYFEVFLDSFLDFISEGESPLSNRAEDICLRCPLCKRENFASLLSWRERESSPFLLSLSMSFCADPFSCF